MRLLTLLLLDLDDTLLDTSGVLAPAAHREAIEAMIGAGLVGDPHALLAERLELSRIVPPDALSLTQVARHGQPDPAIAAAGDRAYFDREVPPISLEDGVEAMLRRLQGKRRLVLVTSGVERTQRAKVERLGLSFLDDLIYAPVGGMSVKEAAFREAQARYPTPNEQVAVIGDRLDSEIRAANALGLWAIHVDRGEGARRSTTDPDGVAALRVTGPLGIEGAILDIEARLALGERPTGGSTSPQGLRSPSDPGQP